MKNKIVAFTLVELLIAVTVMLILSTFVFLSAGSSSKRAKDDKLISDMNNVSIALDQYSATNSRQFPDCNSASTFLVCGETISFANNIINSKLNDFLQTSSIEASNRSKIKYVTSSANSFKAAVYILKDDLYLKTTAEHNRLCNVTSLSAEFPAITGEICTAIIK